MYVIVPLPATDLKSELFPRMDLAAEAWDACAPWPYLLGVVLVQQAIESLEALEDEVVLEGLALRTLVLLNGLREELGGHVLAELARKWSSQDELCGRVDVEEVRAADVELGNNTNCERGR